MSIGAQKWNERVVRFLQRNRVISVMAPRKVEAPHPWQVRGRWDAAAGAVRVSVRPGTVNGVVALLNGVELDAVPRPTATVARWVRAAFSENAYLEAKYGVERAALEFAAGAEGATAKKLSAITATGVPEIPTAADVRQLRRVTVSVVHPMPTVRPEIDVAAVSAGDPEGARMIIVEPPDAVPRVQIGPEATAPDGGRVWAGIPGLEGIELRQDAGAVQVIARVYAVSPPGVPVTAEPGADWRIYVAQEVFRPLSFGVRLPVLSPSPRGGLTLPRLGAGNDIIQALLADAGQRSGSVFGADGEAVRVRGRFWSL